MISKLKEKTRQKQQSLYDFVEIENKLCLSKNQATHVTSCYHDIFEGGEQGSGQLSLQREATKLSRVSVVKLRIRINNQKISTYHQIKHPIKEFIRIF